MCGRYYEIDGVIHIVGDGFAWDRAEAAGQWSGSRNACPSQQLPIALLQDGRRVLTLARWGLPLPYKRRDPRARHLINARSDNLSRTFAGAFGKPGPAQGRCIAVASGFYEWQKDGAGKQPYAISRVDGEPLALAALWMTLPEPEPALPLAESADAPVQERRGFVVLTCEPCAEVAPIHDRQPVILQRADWLRWLDPATPADELKALLGPLPDGTLTASPYIASNDP